MAKTENETVVGKEWNKEIQKGFFFGFGFFLANLLGWIILGIIAWIIIAASHQAGSIL